MKVNNQATRVALYCRVSTTDKGQDPNLQLIPLKEYCKAREWQVAGEYIDVGQSGDKDHRPELDRLLNDARKRKIDCIIVWKLDRWGRSLKHLINSLSELQSLGVAFVSYQENIDLSTPSGKMMFHIIGAMAEFERELIRERVKAGIQNAQKKGVRVGRKALPPIVADNVRELRTKGQSIRTIAKKLKLSVGAVHKTLSNLLSDNGLNA
jgi:DNA invertase Pin-like site-specific DNA recombinase